MDGIAARPDRAGHARPGRRAQVVTVVLAVASVIGMSLSIPSDGAHAAGVTYVVSPSGNDGNPGTESQPWRTIGRALRVDSPAGAGDKVLVKAGRYDENVYNGRSGEQGRPLVITGESGATVHPVSDSGWTGGVFATRGTHDLVIENLTFVADTATVWAGISLSDVRNVVVQGNATSGSWASGIIVFPSTGAGHVTSSNVKILNNTLRDVNNMTPKTGLLGGALCTVNGQPMKCDQESLSVWGVDGFEIANNTLDGGSKEGLDVKDGSRNGSVHNNDISHQARLTSSGAGLYAAGGGPALYVDGGAAELFNVDVYANRLHNNFGDGIVISDEISDGPTHDIYVHDNIVYDTVSTPGGGALNACLVATNGVHAVTFENNTCHNNGFSLWVQTAWAGSPSTIVFRNNIVSSSRKDPVSFVSGSDLTLVNNLIAPTGFSAGNASVNSGNITAGSAGFVNAAGGDFRLTSGSPAIDAGAPVQFAHTDAFGGAVPSGGRPDIGAVELGARQGTAPPPPTPPPPSPNVPPVTTPPVTRPPDTRPPATRPPVTQPPVTQPPVVQPPPVVRPPVTQPPVTQPPDVQPPIQPPPAVQPPVATPPSSTTTTTTEEPDEPRGAPRIGRHTHRPLRHR